jgi:carbon storage regulator
MIGDDIEITIVGIKGGKVRIGIQAPHFIPVHRKEVYLAIKQANIEAAKAEVDVIDKLSKIKKLALQVKHKKPGG